MFRVSVIDPPAPIVEPGDIAASNGLDEAAIAAMIAAVTEEIDGPTGWLGRSLGPQTLELVTSDFSLCDMELPFRPIIAVESIEILDPVGEVQTVDPSHYRVALDILLLTSRNSWPAVGHYPDAVRIRYRAGYDGEDLASGGTGDVPERARQAIILSVQHLLSVGAENLFLRSEEVDGVGIRSYTVTDQATNLIHATTDRLLQGLRVYA